MHRIASILFFTVATSFLASGASAQTTHVVAPGHTLAKIARRYHTSIEALREANDLGPGEKLKPGQRIVVPGPEDGRDSSRSTTVRPANSRDEELDSVRDRKRLGPNTTEAGAQPARHLGIVTLLRGNESWSGKTRERSGRILPGVADQFRRLLRDASGTRDVDPRLIGVVTQISEHFGGRPIEVVSGYRPYVEGQPTAHSNHNVGRAVDFVVRGVANEVVRDYCHTLRDVGVGYYPRSSFIHLDVRNVTTHWVDESGPGEAPRYTSISNLPATSDSTLELKYTKSRNQPTPVGSGSLRRD